MIVIILSLILITHCLSTENSLFQKCVSESVNLETSGHEGALEIALRASD